ncbi:hypothetical protein [Agrobacterium sp. 10MFCol1.1]|uniref:hypothetical protein n=1 Tax=Agrobacterium sp. 10MFCol1.1 TaxID=1150775 RepID=UPI00036D8F41|nr:hypothetical protein [Agrobacterium sp. 10MFCol1.1]
MKFDRELLETGIASAFERYSKNPWIKIGSTVAALSAAFIAGVLYRIGPDLLPLVDRGELIGSIAISTATAVVIFKLVSALISSLYSSDGGINRLRRRGYDFFALLMDMSTKQQIACFAATLILSIFFLFRALVYGEILSLFAAAIVVFLSVAYTQARQHHWHKMLSSLALLCLVVAFLSGSLWVESNRYLSPVSIKIGDQVETKAHLVLRGQSGLFLFIRDEKSVTFVPWDEVKLIKSNETPLRILASPI